MNTLLVMVFGALAASACAGHSDRTQAARTALDAGRTREAVDLYDEQLGVDSPERVPAKVSGDQALLLLDRATVLQALDMYELSSRDLQIADKQIEVLDFSRGTLDDISKYMFSDDSGAYQAPPYEKLLINTLGMVNYLVRGDLSGARVEARRFSTMQKFLADSEGADRALSGPGSYLAGFVFERSGEPGAALRYYDEALQYGDYRSLDEPVRRLAQLDPYRTPRISKLVDAQGPAPAEDDHGEVLVIVSYGRVPAKIAKRVPVGLALTLASGYISPYDHARANRLALQGLVTWVNYPTLGEPRGEYGVPEVWVSGRPVPVEGIVAVDRQAIAAWKAGEGKIVASAITRMLTRVIAGEAARKVSGGGVLGLLLGLGTQATMTAADTPDTRSWSTLPARIAIARMRLPPGDHTLDVAVRGVRKRHNVRLAPRGWAVVNLTVLR